MSSHGDQLRGGCNAGVVRDDPAAPVTIRIHAISLDTDATHAYENIQVPELSDCQAWYTSKGTPQNVNRNMDALPSIL